MKNILIIFAFIFIGCGDSYEKKLQEKAKEVTQKTNINSDNFEKCFVKYIKSNYSENEYNANSLVYIGKAIEKCK